MTGVADGGGPGWTARPAKVSWDVMDVLGEIEGIGGDPVRGGYSRHVFEPAEMELREWFTRRARALGLAVERGSGPDRPR
jgi:hypothetical protein